MEKMKISAIQMNSKIGDVKANIEKVKTLIERDVESDVDLIILPEVWTCGWKPDVFQSTAEVIRCGEWSVESEVVSKAVLNEYHSDSYIKYSTLNPPHSKLNVLYFLSNIAKQYNSWVIGGSVITKRDEKFYNSCPVFGRNGELVCIYDKNHLFSYYGCQEGSFVEKGKSPVMVDIEGINVGLTICYDIRFPEIYRAYRKAGADLLVNVAAWGLNKPVPWECMTRSRAVENQTYTVALTQCGYVEGDVYNIGHSRILDYKGETLSEIKDQKEGAMTAVLDFGEMYDFRDKCRCIDDIKENYEVIKL